MGVGNERARGGGGPQDGMKCRYRAEKLGFIWLRSSREGLRGSHLGLEGWVRLRLVSGMKWGSPCGERNRESQLTCSLCD